MAISKDNKRKIGIYGINFLTPSAINFVKTLPKAAKSIKNTSALDNILSVNMANPIGAAYFGVLDIVGGFSKKIKDSKFTRLSKIIGLGIYGCQTAADIFSIANGHYEDILKLLFDSSMTYQLGKDSFEAYKSGNDLWTDIANW